LRNIVNKSFQLMNFFLAFGRIPMVAATPPLSEIIMTTPELKAAGHVCHGNPLAPGQPSRLPSDAKAPHPR
jgi:hypothetical protein